MLTVQIDLAGAKMDAELAPKAQTYAGTFTVRYT